MQLYERLGVPCGVTAVIGSGGKTTLLRMIAGFNTIEGGARGYRIASRRHCLRKLAASLLHCPRSRRFRCLRTR